MNTTVWVMTYEHRHGVDVSAFASEIVGWRGIASLILENLDSGEYDEYNETEAVKAECAAIMGEREEVASLTVAECQAIDIAFEKIPHNESFDIGPRPVIEEM